MKRYGKDKGEFLLFPRLPFSLRLLLSFLIMLLIFTLQIEGIELLWIPLFLFLFLLNWVRSVKIPPPSFSGTGRKWKPVTEKELRMAIEQSKKVRRVKATLAGKAVWLIFLTIFSVVFVVMFSSFAPGLFRFLFGGSAGSYLLLDLVLLSLAAIFTGNRSIWEPPELPEKLEAIKVAYEHLQELRDPIREDSIQFEVVETKEGKYVPTDVKIFSRFKDGDSNFYGVQYQVSINEVQNKKYPYFYAVLIAKREFQLRDKFKGIEKEEFPSWLIFEYRPQSDVDVLVLRQATSRSRGYYTSDRRIKEITEQALFLAKKILKLNTSLR